MIDIQTTSPWFRSVRFFIPALFGKEFHLNLQSFLWRRHFGASSEGHQHGGRKAAERSVIGKRKIIILEFWYIKGIPHLVQELFSLIAKT